MSGFSPHYTSHGRWACPYCSKRWKRMGSFIEEHIRTKHFELATKDECERINGTLKRQNERLEAEMREVQKRSAEKKTFYTAVIFCTNDKQVRRVGMPRGVLVEDVTCDICGTQTLVLVANGPNIVINR